MGFSNEEIRIAAKKLLPYLKKVEKAQDGEYAIIQNAKDDVLSQYQPLFSLEHIPDLTEEEYRSFLMFRNNRHWRSLQRMGPSHTADMDLLRLALGILLDERIELIDRLDKILPEAGPMIPRFGAATITPILMVAYPNQYGVLNKPSEDALRKIGLWPDVSRKASFSTKYSEANKVLLALAVELDIDLWTLDILWWAVLLDNGQAPDNIEFEDDLDSDTSQVNTHRFGLERYLQEFLRDNWENISEFSDWYLYEQDGDIVGVEYNTNEVGRIDLLARHKTESRWLVIELKRQQSSDQTLGQILRYMGWVDKNLKADDEEVAGLIISRNIDTNIHYALKQTRNVEIMLYDVAFSLRSV